MCGYLILPSCTLQILIFWFWSCVLSGFWILDLPCWCGLLITWSVLFFDYAFCITIWICLPVLTINFNCICICFSLPFMTDYFTVSQDAEEGHTWRTMVPTQGQLVGECWNLLADRFNKVNLISQALTTTATLQLHMPALPASSLIPQPDKYAGETSLC